MKTYAESQGKRPFNWNEFLAKETIAETEWSEAEILSRSWVTCACGNVCDAIPRHNSDADGFTPGSPVDDRLRHLGILFSDSIIWRRTYRAKELLLQIEARSAELLAKPV
jgi:hypothetical protein